MNNVLQQPSCHVCSVKPRNKLQDHTFCSVSAQRTSYNTYCTGLSLHEVYTVCIIYVLDEFDDKFMKQ